MAPGAKLLALSDQSCASGQVKPGEKLIQQGDGLLVAHDNGVLPAGKHRPQRSAVIRLHVLDDNIVQIGSVQRLGSCRQECIGYRSVHRVKQDILLIPEQVGVIGHPLRYRVCALKQCKTPVRGADKQQVVRDFPDAHVIILHYRTVIFSFYMQNPPHGRGGRLRQCRTTMVAQMRRQGIDRALCGAAFKCA